MPLPVAEFVRKWKLYAHSERGGSQEHFLDLCLMLDHPSPAAADSVGERFAFDKPVRKTDGGKGFADVWLRDHFAWEYKGKHKDLKRAYTQLNDYREDLGNAPLLVVCDLDRFEVHTNFTSTYKRVYAFTLDDLAKGQVTPTCPLPPIEVLRALFDDTNQLRPERTDAFVTQEAAKRFAKLAEQMEGRPLLTQEDTETPARASNEHTARFLIRILFCLFADSIGLLPDRVFRRLIEIDRHSPGTFLLKLDLLFRAMSAPRGIFGEHTIRYFNGGLFRADEDLRVPLDFADMAILYEVAHRYDWSHVAPAIFGTLFERSLDPGRRSLIGAHYTSEEDILLLIEPVVMRPLRARWAAARADVAAALQTNEPTGPALLRSNERAEALLAGWFDELAAVRVLDPACGSGNFLYVALRELLDLWKEAHDFAIEHDLKGARQHGLNTMVSPAQLFGIEVEFYAHELASIVVWIGFLQWKHRRAYTDYPTPLLRQLSNIELGDAILRYDADGKAFEPEWPQAEFIVGNPPFLGGKLLRRELGDLYVDALFKLYGGRVRAESDLVVYWFEAARRQLERGAVKRVGLLATQGIRGGANRAVLDRIQATGNIFWAWSDRDWLLKGATVHVSMIAFDAGEEEGLTLNGEPVAAIHADLSSGSHTASAVRLKENAGICFMGTTKVGPFDIDAETARKMLTAPLNVNGRQNADVVRPWVNALDITRRPRGMYIIDFGTDMTEKDAAMYEMPFEYIKQHVKPKRLDNNRTTYASNWWLHGEARGDLRRAIKPLSRYILTPSVSKHRLFVWTPVNVVPDHATFVFAREDDYFFGVLHSSAHELWARAMGTQLREVESGFRYTPNSTFDTFPFPWPPGTEPSGAEDGRVRAVAEAARELAARRDAWLHPPDATEEQLKEKTLTKLYNQRPEWLAGLHRALDAAVFAVYGWPDGLGKQEVLARLLALNGERAGAKAPTGVAQHSRG